MDNKATDYLIENMNVSTLGYSEIINHSSFFIDKTKRSFYDIAPLIIEIDSGLFTHPAVTIEFPDVSVVQTENAILVSCPCDAPKKKLCEHGVQVLYNIIDRQELRIFFDVSLRNEKIRRAARDFGLENIKTPDEHFSIEYSNKSILIKPKVKELIALTTATTQRFKESLLKQRAIPIGKAEEEIIIVFYKNKYYDQSSIELFEAGISKEGKVKNPLKAVDAIDLVWKTENIDEVKFYAAVSRFRDNPGAGKTESVVESLKIIVQNPLNYKVFYHNPKANEQVAANSLVAAQLRLLDIDLIIHVDLKNSFYEISGELVVDQKSHELKTLQLRYDYFVLINNTLYLVTNKDFLNVIDFFRNNNQKLIIHENKFEAFQQNILDKLEEYITIKYSYIKPATYTQLEEQGFNTGTEKIIYLSDHDNFVGIMPVVRYGNVEIPVFSRKLVKDVDQNGNVFTVERNEELETRFTSLLLQQHGDFNEQLNKGDSFYLHKGKFLDENWFHRAFDEWKNEGILILGFNEIKNNRLNENKAIVSVSVNSGIDWFNASIKVEFGKQQASLKQLHKSIRNKSKYVQLDDGTVGILPDEWLKKFAAYFQTGDILNELIRIPKINFSTINSLFEKEQIGKDAINELNTFKKAFSNFNKIENIAVPEGLNATLRHYQQDGLNWLNFLDDFNFGGCLADDMGLGKTIQVIAFILSQRQKRTHNTNLVVVPASLIFNWQAEVEKFAPSIRIFTNYGNQKLKEKELFDNYEIILTTYGTLISDISLLKEYRFNYIFLDESQAIKNPESQRYKAARLLQSRNKIALTGTPVENNTFDLFGQLSFACPGLLGNKQYFRDLYSIPIDKFKDTKRAVELQKIINPFILRRTKKQVAKELPEKTEMVIYCEMGAEQRNIYDNYEKDLREYIERKKEEDLPKSSMHVLTGLTKLRQICNSPELLNEGLPAGNSAKIEVLIKQIENKSPQHKILVFSQFVTMLDLIKKELELKQIPFEYLTGQTRDRASSVNAFQNNKNVRVFLISLKAGGTGLNLTEADYVYIIDPWWNPAVENQAIDRSHRIGQSKHVIAVRLICPNTVEEKIMKLQLSKKQLADELVKTDVSVFKSLAKTDLLNLLR